MEDLAPKTVAQFVSRIRGFLVSDKNQSEDEMKIQNLKYVIYARKSTDTAEKQERSIPDQIIECRQIAERNGLNVVKILHEEKSAKNADNRPIFHGMIKDILQGKYDAILTWAPDRLARNMKEAGEIIDLLDKGDIKDIKFANGWYFNNDSAGKMMLGIAFVQAKQFSDTHSQNVKRGVKRITAEGKIYGTTKHGYYKDTNQFARPDGENWELIRGAFKMRLSKDTPSSLKEIAIWLREQGYPRRTSHTNRKAIILDEKFLSDLFRDPFYAGAYIHGDQVVDLVEKSDFEPLITPEEFDTLTKDGNINKKFLLADNIKSRGSVKANLMRDMVVCLSCQKPMSAGITPKQLPDGSKNYFYYRCDTLACANRGKSIRAKVIIAAALEFLDKHPINLGEGYKAYKQEMERLKLLYDKRPTSEGQIAYTAT